MNRFVLCLCFALALVMGLVAPAFATQGTVNGVLVQERVVNLPQDESKWYISVVGNAGEARYRDVLSWFDTNAHLKNLKQQVHFCSVKSDSTVYRERYAPNVKGLPTVRVQDSKGNVIYEAAGNTLPMTPEGLYVAIANDVQTTQGLRPILPWRRNMDQKCPCPNPNPDSDPLPPEPLDPEPQPLAPAPTPPSTPNMPPVESALPPWWAMLAAIAAGAVPGVVQKWKETYALK